jgi:hypothetical protein
MFTADPAPVIYERSTGALEVFTANPVSIIYKRGGGSSAFTAKSEQKPNLYY